MESVRARRSLRGYLSRRSAQAAVACRGGGCLRELPHRPYSALHIWNDATRRDAVAHERSRLSRPHFVCRGSACRCEGGSDVQSADRGDAVRRYRGTTCRGRLLLPLRSRSRGARVGVDRLPEQGEPLERSRVSGGEGVCVGRGRSYSRPVCETDSAPASSGEGVNAVLAGDLFAGDREKSAAMRLATIAVVRARYPVALLLIAGPPSNAPSALGSSVSSNPLAGARLFGDPGSNAARQVAEWRATRPEDAAQMEKIASTSQADWFVGDSGAAFRREVAARTRKIVRAKALPVFVLYNIPRRDCGAYSAGGARSGAASKRWNSDLAAGAGRRKLAVVIELDALAGLDCLGPGLVRPDTR